MNASRELDLWIDGTQISRKHRDIIESLLNENTKLAAENKQLKAQFVLSNCDGTDINKHTDV